MGNRAAVALLTPASVACADSTTATRSVNGLTNLSSPLGTGLAAANRSKIASVLAALFLPGLFSRHGRFIGRRARRAKRECD